MHTDDAKPQTDSVPATLSHSAQERGRRFPLNHQLLAKACQTTFWLITCFVATPTVGLGQTPEAHFRKGGANFRDTPPEQRLYWQSHIEQSHRRILEAADRAKGKGIATVLGSGVGIEIPLAELARRFDRLILVDMDGPSMLESLEQVPLQLRSKVELRVMDITSFATTLMERLRDATDASSTAEEAFRRYDTIFNELNLGNPVNLPTSDLVVSSLVLSEVPRAPFTYTTRLLQARFGIPLETWAGFDRAFEKLMLLAVEDHVRLLALLSRSGGVVYYSDTLARGPAYGQFSPETRTAVEANVLADFQRLGLAESADAVGLVVGRLCRGEYPIKTEIEAYERLLAAYRHAGDNAFEPLLPIAEVLRQFERRGFAVQGAPQSWWWLSYPCAISHQAPGGFIVSSWIFNRSGFE